MITEVGKITLVGDTTGTFTFTTPFPSVPVITAITADTSSADSANVNIYVSSVTTSAVTFKTSAPMTGDIHFHAIYVS